SFCVRFCAMSFRRRHVFVPAPRTQYLKLELQEMAAARGTSPDCLFVCLGSRPNQNNLASPFAGTSRQLFFRGLQIGRFPGGSCTERKMARLVKLPPVSAHSACHCSRF